MTAEVNVAIEAAFNAGAKEVVVSDSHGTMRNILIEDLDPRAQLIAGYPREHLMVSGIDETFSAAIPSMSTEIYIFIFFTLFPFSYIIDILNINI